MTTETPPIPESILNHSQKKKYGPRKCPAYGPNAQIIAEVRYDDECRNGHNTFAITADIYDPTKKGHNREIAGGCCHEEIAAAFPELAPLIKWHLTSSDGPMHYVANVVYLAGNRDCNGLLKGEFRQHTSRGPNQANGVPGVPCWELAAVPGWADRTVYSNEKPAPITLEWQAYGRTGEGKERELESARHAAVWPEATDEELSQEPEKLKETLLWRLPQLLQDFRAAVQSLGFTY